MKFWKSILGDRESNYKLASAFLMFYVGILVSQTHPWWVNAIFFVSGYFLFAGLVEQYAKAYVDKRFPKVGTVTLEDLSDESINKMLAELAEELRKQKRMNDEG